MTLASFEALQLFLFFFLLYGIALISVRLMQAVAVVLFVANSVSLYFITTYGVELDDSMIANILNTDTREARAFDNREIVLLPDASFAASVPAGQKDVVVLMIGESSRRANSSMYGYARETMPEARAHGMIALQNGMSCATNTIAAVSCILSYQGSKAPPVANYEPLPSYLQRMGVEMIVRLNNTGTPPLNVAQNQWANEVVAGCTENCPDKKSDAALVYGLAERIAAAKSDRVFVLIHVTGGPGPAYFKKYPPEFERFTPVCKSVQLADCTADELVNADDNTIVFTDALLGQVIDQVASLMAAKGIMAADISTAKVAAQDIPFHTVMGAFGMTSPIYKPQFDLFAVAP
ncbi:MAG: sulfatase-like hydrolase/transferase [Cypionkella sp.]|nr:sulfatase-like hydrolase/transferase [Cypionkella sp.]